jgi:glycosyltransferase involved in cell wall biosynthesis
VKFSVVIPTHNRLDLLQDAVESVRRQEGTDWELVVFDNASTEDIAGHVRSLSDARVRYARSDAFLPVTDSWNSAIDLASGDYVIFLGDDDGLAPGYFAKMASIIDEFRSPEVIYCAIYQFLHPGVAPWERRGYVAELKNGFFFEGRDAPFLLSREDAAKAIAGSIGLRRNFTFNIQAFTFSRAVLERLRRDGAVFRSPFPDYYLANIALAKARSTLVVPTPMSIAGVSRASFGFTLFNNMEEKGAEILNAKLAADPLYAEVEEELLPGPLYNTNYVLTMEHVARYAPEFARRGVNYRRYRRLQTLAMLNAGNGRLSHVKDGELLWSRLTSTERLWARFMALSLLAGRILGMQGLVWRVLNRLVGPYSYHPRQVICDRGSYSRLIEVFEAIQSGVINAALK